MMAATQQFSISLKAWREYCKALGAEHRRHDKHIREAQEQWNNAVQRALRSSKRAAPAAAKQVHLLDWARLARIERKADSVDLVFEGSDFGSPGAILRVQVLGGAVGRLRLPTSRQLEACEFRRGKDGLIHTIWIFRKKELTLSGRAVRILKERNSLRVAQRHRCSSAPMPHSVSIVQIAHHPPLGLAGADGTRNWSGYRGWMLSDSFFGKPDSDNVITWNIGYSLPIAFCPFCQEELPAVTPL